MKWAGKVAHTDRRGMKTGFLVKKPEGRRPLVRPRCRWMDNIEMYFR
jgi:hypothetical protein